jgi:hypothetical protein
MLQSLKTVWAAVLLVACLFSTPAFAQTPDLRVIVIDDDLFALIDNSAERTRAIDDVIADIERIVAAYPQQVETIVLYHEGNAVDDLYGLSRGNGFVASLADSWLFDAMEKGRSAGSHTGDYGINIYELRSKMFDILRNEGMDRLRDTDYRQIDMHIFGNTWFRNNPNSAGNMLTHEYAGLCYQLNDESTYEWPANVTLAIEVRPPEGYAIPHPRALHGLMTLLAGSSATNGPVQMRGTTPKGPNCEMSPTLSAFVDLDYSSTDPDLCRAPMPAPSGNGQSRCEPDDHPAIGNGLDERPVHLVSRSDTLVIGQYTFTTAGAGMTAQITTGFGGPVLSPGAAQTAPRMGGRQVSASLDLLQQAGCQPNGLIEAELQAGAGSLQVVTSRAACRPTSIPLGGVTLQ